MRVVWRATQLRYAKAVVIGWIAALPLWLVACLLLRGHDVPFLIAGTVAALFIVGADISIAVRLAQMGRRA